MAKISKELPREVQSDLHDMADRVGERVARNAMVGLHFERPSTTIHPAKCICERFSKRNADGSVDYWNIPDPECKYYHLTSLAEPFTVKPADMKK